MNTENSSNFNTYSKIETESQEQNNISNTKVNNNFDIYQYTNDKLTQKDNISSLNFKNECEKNKNYNNLFINKKYLMTKNLFYNNNLRNKVNKSLGFDIHIRDADDSAFEKLIID